MVTVDIDPRLDFSEEMPSGEPLARKRHVVGDALCDRLGDAIGLRPGSIDVAMSNPPYRAARWRPGFATILERAGLGSAIAFGGTAPTDLIFLAQAIHLVRSGGLMAFVVPDSTISGRRAAKLRALLLAAHGIERVIQLPRGAFTGTDAQAFAMIVRKDRPVDRVMLERVDASGLWEQPVTINMDEACARLDHGHYGGTRTMAGTARLRDVGVSIRRGTATSAEAAASSKRIFHTCDFPARTGEGIALVGASAPGSDRGVLAEPGDILMARVDRRLETKIALVVSGFAHISDCVFRFRAPSGASGTLLTELTSRRGQDFIIRNCRGTGAKHIAIASLMELRI